MAITRELPAYCGHNCSECPAYMATQNNDQEALRQTAEKWSAELNLNITPEECVCDGCRPFEGARHGGYCNECPVRACGITKSYPNCAYCPDYPCENLDKFDVGVAEVKERLDSIRRQIGRE